MRVEARRNEADTRSGDGEIVYGVARSIPSSLIPSFSVSPSLRTLLRSSFPITHNLSVSLVASLPMPRAGIVGKLGQSLVVASRRLALGIRRKGRFSFRPSAAASLSPSNLRYSYAPTLSAVTTLSEPPLVVIRRETPGPISRTLSFGLFGSRIRVALFRRRAYLVSSFLSWPISLVIAPPRYVLAPWPYKGLKAGFLDPSFAPHSFAFLLYERIVSPSMTFEDSKFPRLRMRTVSNNNNFGFCWYRGDIFEETWRIYTWKAMKNTKKDSKLSVHHWRIKI